MDIIAHAEFRQGSVVVVAVNAHVRARARRLRFGGDLRSGAGDRLAFAAAARGIRAGDVEMAQRGDPLQSVLSRQAQRFR